MAALPEMPLGPSHAHGGTRVAPLRLIEIYEQKIVSYNSNNFNHLYRDFKNVVEVTKVMVSQCLSQRTRAQYADGNAGHA